MRKTRSRRNQAIQIWLTAATLGVAALAAGVFKPPGKVFEISPEEFPRTGHNGNWSHGKRRALRLVLHDLDAGWKHGAHRFE